jgi:hypothetical protein
MPPKKKNEPFVGDTINSLAQVDKAAHWSAVYIWYTELSIEGWRENRDWNFGLMRAECIVEVVKYCKSVLVCQALGLKAPHGEIG